MAVYWRLAMTQAARGAAATEALFATFSSNELDLASTLRAKEWWENKDTFDKRLDPFVDIRSDLSSIEIDNFLFYPILSKEP